MHRDASSCREAARRAKYECGEIARRVCHKCLLAGEDGFSTLCGTVPDCPSLRGRHETATIYTDFPESEGKIGYWDYIRGECLVTFE